MHPHMLRHTYVTTTLDAGVSLRDVQIAARHADPKTTMRPGVDELGHRDVRRGQDRSSRASPTASGQAEIRLAASTLHGRRCALTGRGPG
jgi:integrase